ncbi:MAG: hypothetical protein N2662_05560 [Bacteroidales bacterium]|nr:hypothetical protein [Bacteroidales bacterium]
MKTIKLFLIALSLSIGFTSCSKDDDGKKDGTGSAVIDGKTVELSYCYFAQTSYGGYNITSIILATSQNQGSENFQQITISYVGNNLEKKEYTVGQSSEMSFLYTTTSESTSYAGSGKVTITDISSSVIKGKYDVKLLDITGKDTGKTLKGEFSAKKLDTSNVPKN